MLSPASSIHAKSPRISENAQVVYIWNMRVYIIQKLTKRWDCYDIIVLLYLYKHFFMSDVDAGRGRGEIIMHCRRIWECLRRRVKHSLGRLVPKQNCLPTFLTVSSNRPGTKIMASVPRSHWLQLLITKSIDVKLSAKAMLQYCLNAVNRDFYQLFCLLIAFFLSINTP